MRGVSGQARRGHVEVEQRDGNAKFCGTRTDLVPLLPRPEAVLKNHVETERQDALREVPLDRLDGGSLRFVVAVTDESRHPLVGHEAKRPVLMLELPCQRGFPGSREPADQEQGRHARILDDVAASTRPIRLLP